MQREVMTHSSHRIRYRKSLARQSLVQSTAKLCRGLKKPFFLPTYASMKTCAQPAWSEPAQTDSSRKCLHSDICLNVKRSCCTIMNTKWINNDIWIMNTIYSSSDKILSFLACTGVNYLTQASVTACQALFWHTTAIYCHWEEWQPPTKLASQACLFFLITKQVCVLKVFGFSKVSVHPSFSYFRYK